MKMAFKITTIALIAILSTLAVFAVSAQVPVKVLGSSDTYAILAETAITNTGTTSITGNVGISPDGASSITGLTLTEDSSLKFWTSPFVTGEVYSANNAPPTPTVLTTAVADMTNAYTVLDGLTTPAPTPLPTTLNGNTLVAGIYKTASNVVISGEITLRGTASATWVFQIAGTLTVHAGVQIILSGGALASNVYWVVAGDTTLEAGSIMVGNILDASYIAMQSEASITGRLLSQTAVTLIGNTIREPAVTIITPTPTTSPTSVPTPRPTFPPRPTPHPTPITSPIPTHVPCPIPTRAPYPTQKPCR